MVCVTNKQGNIYRETIQCLISWSLVGVHSVEQLLDHLDVHFGLSHRLVAELEHLVEHEAVGVAENVSNLLYAEGRPRRVIRAILDVYYVAMLTPLQRLLVQVEEADAVQAVLQRVEVVAEELEELGQILAESTVLIDAERVQEGRGHQHNRIRVESPRVWLVQIVLGKQLLYY